jgi:transposase
MKITTVGIDLAKNVFQVHAVDHSGCGLERQQSGVELVCRSTRHRPSPVGHEWLVSGCLGQANSSLDRER